MFVWGRKYLYIFSMTTLPPSRTLSWQTSYDSSRLLCPTPPPGQGFTFQGLSELLSSFALINLYRIDISSYILHNKQYSRSIWTYWTRNPFRPGDNRRPSPAVLNQRGSRRPATLETRRPVTLDQAFRTIGWDREESRKPVVKSLPPQVPLSPRRGFEQPMWV